MFLTRLGFGSKMVVTGDVTQVDLPGGTRSGLRVVEEILDGLEDVAFNRLTSHDVVRHRLVGRIVAAYDQFEARDSAPAFAHGRSPRRASRDPPDGRMSVEVLEESGGAGRRPPAGQAEPLRPRTPAGAPAGRAVHQAHRRGRDRAVQREVDGPGRAHGRVVLPHGRASAGHRQRGTGGRHRRRPHPVSRRSPSGRPPTRASAVTPATRTTDELDLLTVHGILHLLGYDHAEPDEHREMFGLQARLLAEWQAVRSGARRWRSERALCRRTSPCSSQPRPSCSWPASSPASTRRSPRSPGWRRRSWSQRAGGARSAW